MPIYEFVCSDKNCNEHYEVLTKYDKSGKYKSVKCPICGSPKKKQQFSGTFAFNFTNPVGTDLWRSSHDYRFKTKLPGAVSERENAQKKSHMGSAPYRNIDDISGGKYFGKVK